MSPHDRLPEEVLGVGAWVLAELVARGELGEAAHRARPQRRDLGEHREPRADVLASFGVVGGVGEHRITGAPPRFDRSMKFFGRDAETRRIASYLVERDQAVVAIKCGVLDSLGHHGPGELLKLRDHLGLGRSASTKEQDVPEGAPSSSSISGRRSRDAGQRELDGFRIVIHGLHVGIGRGRESQVRSVDREARHGCDQGIAELLVRRIAKAIVASQLSARRATRRPISLPNLSFKM